MKATDAASTKPSTNETVMPLMDDVKDFSEAEVVSTRFRDMQLRNPDYANLTFEQARHFFEEVKSEYEEIPDSLTFEEALASNFFAERKKRSIVSDDEAYHVNLKAKGRDFANLIKLEKLRRDMIKVTLDLTTKQLAEFLVDFRASNFSGFFNYPIPVSPSMDTESLRHILTSVIGHWTHFELNEIEKQLEEEISMLTKRDKRSMRARFPKLLPKPECQIDLASKISYTPFVLLRVSSSLGLLASLILICKAFCCKK